MSRRAQWRRGAAAAAATLALLAAGCEYKAGPSNPMNVPWASDMYLQPSLYPQELPVAPPPAGAVPVEAEPPPLPHLVAAERLRNPVPMTEASVKRGEALFRIFCTPCHGADGKGQGPVAARFVPPPPLDSPAIKGRADGYLYATIRQGSLAGIMPAYGYRMTEQERWDLVNYLRRLQGVTPRGAEGPAGTREASRR
ncbi:MAG TPA: cytochrome c [Thermodesulfobacteriota bacterium]|nr:cytochrome c [Thermodesulfobacteriota bacterium]